MEQEIERTSLQNIIKWADEADEEPGGAHHYRTISYEKALKAIQQLDRLVERELQIEQAKLNNKTEHSYREKEASLQGDTSLLFYGKYTFICNI